MGIKNLNELFKFLKKIKKNGTSMKLSELIDKSIQKKCLGAYTGKKIAIDSSIYLYKNKYNGKAIIEEFFKQILKLLQFNITPVYVFDGAPPKEKSEVLLERRLIKNKLQNQINDLMEAKSSFEENIEANIEEIKVINEAINQKNKQYINVSSDDIDKCMTLFDYMGIPYIKAPGEAEVFCVELYKDNLVDACISEDYDILANGGNIFIKGFNHYSNNVTEYNLNNILLSLELTYDQFVEICILCGCDYTSKIKGVGPINSYKLIKKYNTIDKCIEMEFSVKSKYTIPDDFNFVAARHLFHKRHFADQLRGLSRKSIKIVEPKLSKLLSYLKHDNIKITSKYATYIRSIYSNYFAKNRSKQKKRNFFSMNTRENLKTYIQNNENIPDVVEIEHKEQYITQKEISIIPVDFITIAQKSISASIVTMQTNVSILATTM